MTIESYQQYLSTENEIDFSQNDNNIFNISLRVHWHWLQMV